VTTFVEAAIPSSLANRKGWHEVELLGLPAGCWGELWLDLGLGFIRYHSVPLGRTPDMVMSVRIRLHRKALRIALRIGGGAKLATLPEISVRSKAISAISGIAGLLSYRGFFDQKLFCWERLSLGGLQAYPVAAGARGREANARWQELPDVPGEESPTPDTAISFIVARPFAKPDGAPPLWSLCGSVSNEQAPMGGGETESSEPAPQFSNLFEALAHASRPESGWVGVIGPGARLAPGATACLTRWLSDPDASQFDIIYGDEALGAKTDKFGVGLRGEFCVHRLLAGETPAPVIFVSTSAIGAMVTAGALPQATSIHSFLLGALLQADNLKIGHVPITLAMRQGEQPNSLQEDCRTLGLALARKLGLPPAAYRLSARNIVEDVVDVSVIVPTKDRVDLLNDLIESIHRPGTTRPREIIIIDNGSVEGKTSAWFLEMMALYDNIKVIQCPGPFNYSELNNIGAASAVGSVLAFFNNDTRLISPDLLGVCSDLALHPECGAVGPLLLFPNGKIQHAGIVVGPGGVGANALSGASPDADLGDAFPLLTRSVSALTGACLFVAKDKFEAVRGFDANLAVAFNDVDLCLRLEANSFRNVLVPSLRVIHHETQTRQPDRHYDGEPRLKKEFLFVRDRWGDRLDWDPWISPALKVDKGMAYPFWGRYPLGRGL